MWGGGRNPTNYLPLKVCHRTTSRLAQSHPTNSALTLSESESIITRMTGRELLAAWIERSRFNQRQAADFIGVTAGKLSLYLTGRARPGVDVVLRIEDATGVPARSWTLSGLSKTAEVGQARGPNTAVSPSRKA